MAHDKLELLLEQQGRALLKQLMQNPPRSAGEDGNVDQIARLGAFLLGARSL
ncbi:hypothetical protein [Streptomyces sp. NPDC099088]|uniref:hypothetical protein n=1 Tax=Streptomyces sp. NPDC099088 TaxID=3366101 RepID=UPI00382C7B30